MLDNFIHSKDTNISILSNSYHDWCWLKDVESHRVSHYYHEIYNHYRNSYYKNDMISQTTIWPLKLYSYYLERLVLLLKQGPAGNLQTWYYYSFGEIFGPPYQGVEPAKGCMKLLGVIDHCW